MWVHDVPLGVGPPPWPIDPVIEAYKPGIDRTLIIENLRRTPEERLADLASRLLEAARIADELEVIREEREKRGL